MDFSQANKSNLWPASSVQNTPLIFLWGTSHYNLDLGGKSLEIFHFSQCVLESTWTWAVFTQCFVSWLKMCFCPLVTVLLKSLGQLNFRSASMSTWSRQLIGSWSDEQRGPAVQLDPTLRHRVSPHLCSVCASSVDLWHEIVSTSHLVAVWCKE